LFTGFKKIFTVTFLLIGFVLNAQIKPPPPVLISAYQLPADNGYSDLYVTFRISNDKLVFLKDDDGYSGSFEFNVEVLKDDTVVVRKSVTKNININDYESTKSKNHYVQGIIAFRLKNGKYKLIPEIRLDNTNIDVRLKPIFKEIKPDSLNNVLEPLIVFKDGNNFIFTNFENNFPFTNKDIGFLLPVKKTSDTVNIKIIQNDNIIIDTNLVKSNYEGLRFVQESNNIVLRKDSTARKFNYFYLNGFSKNLGEGPVEIKVKVDDKTKVKFRKDVVWYTKPLILYNPEKAVNLLKIIGEDKEVSAIFKHPSKLYYKKLVEYWNRKFPQSGKFNEAMNEFYTRADYALMNFNTLGKTNGLRTDRAKIYIKYGKPTKIERRYSEQNETLEIWKYDHINREFIFIDRTGSGNFKLLGK